MLAFLRDLLAHPRALRTIILLGPDAAGAPRQYALRPGRLLGLVLAAACAIGPLFVAASLLIPLRRVVLGPDVEELRAEAARNARRAEAFEDSVAVQYHQIAQLRALITGDLGTPSAAEPVPAVPAPPDPEGAEVELGARLDTRAPDGRASRAPRARRLRGTDPTGNGAAAPRREAGGPLARLRLPAPPPVDGVLSRPYDADAGHFGLDIAARVGTPVRSLGDGHVVFADWTHAGGFTVGVQHAGGYLAVYKHNQHLLKRVGERVRSREAVALSGNTGAITSGPHLHFELWRDGLAQNPRAYLTVP